MTRIVIAFAVMLGSSVANAGQEPEVGLVVAVRPQSEYIHRFLEKLSAQRVADRLALEDAKRRRGFRVSSTPAERLMWERVVQLPAVTEPSVAELPVESSTASN